MVQDLRSTWEAASDCDVDAIPDRWLLGKIAAENDDQAFAILVRRYSRVVMGVCRRVLHNVHDAEDAFQATFVVLWCKAGAIAKPELLGNWLYGVAFRTAQKLRTQEARRRVREQHAPSAHAVEGVAEEEAWREERALLDQELIRLPEKYRVPLILCYLDGLTHAEVARQLGWPIGSVSARLSRGLQLMRERLSRRNPDFGVALPPMLLAEQSKASWLPNEFLDAIFKILMQPTESSPVNALAQSTMRAMDRSSFWGKALTNTTIAAIVGATIYNGVVIGAMMTGANRAAPVAPASPSPPSVQPTPMPPPMPTQPAGGGCHAPK